MSDSIKPETKDSKEETVKLGIPRTPEYVQVESETFPVIDAMQKVKNCQTENTVSLILITRQTHVPLSDIKRRIVL